MRPNSFSCLILFRTLLPLLVASTTWGGTIATLDDIQFWVGTGSNRAAVVVDWDDTSAIEESLVWGYRWDGVSTGASMLQAVLEADARFFSKQNAAGAAGIALYGLGYDLNDDSEFGITDGTVFDSDGIAISGPPDVVPPTATATDFGDIYAEGWFTGLWNYGLSIGNPFEGGSWAGSGTGASGRTLADGDWDSWAFTPTFNFMAFAETPVAAEAPYSADFDSDDDVDGSDFLAWQRGFGIVKNATLEQGDADGNGGVDGLDLQLWSTNFGFGTASGVLQNTLLVVPEPSCIAGALWVFFVLILGRRPLRGGLCQTTRKKVS